MRQDDRHLPSALGRLPCFDYTDRDAIYSVTLCTEGRHPVFATPSYAHPVLDRLHWLRSHRGVSVYAFCLMPDHLHLLIRPEGSLGSIIKSVKKQTTREIQGLGRPGKLWQDNYYDRILRTGEDGMVVARYILANPARAGLVEEPEKYRWSGLLDPL